MVILLRGKQLVASAIKTQETKYLTLTINRAVHALILERQADIAIICQGKEGNHSVITGKGKEKPLYASNLDRKLNQVLKHTCKVVKKNLKTHIFRIEITTSLIEVGGIEAAQKIIGHSNLTTTAIYNRTHYKEKDFLSLMKKAEKFRKEKGVLRPYVKKEDSTS